MPDLFLPVACGEYHGLFIEMKAAKGRLSEDQKIRLGELQEQGYQAVCCYSAEQAINTLKSYYEIVPKLY